MNKCHLYGVVYLLISFITIGVMAQIEEYNKSKNYIIIVGFELKEAGI